MDAKSAEGNAQLPAALQKAAPRDVRLTIGGVLTVIAAIALLITGVVSEIVLYRRAKLSEEHVSLFMSERRVAGAVVTGVRPRGDGKNRRFEVRYEYAAAGREYSGTTTARPAAEEYQPGSPVAVWYLPTYPDQSWLDGYSPSLQSTWPAMGALSVCGLVAVILIYVVRRQSVLLTNGRAAVAVIRRIDKKKSDKGTYWHVEYEFTLLSGATRSGHYNHSGKHPPQIGSTIVIVHDRDNPERRARYPFSLVKVGSG